MPGPKRDWEANIESDPRFTLHLKRGIMADVAVVGETDVDMKSALESSDGH